MIVGEKAQVMLDKIVNHIICGTEMARGKIVAILLAVSLALMGWNAFTISVAFAADEGNPSASPVVQGESDAPADGKAGETGGNGTAAGKDSSSGEPASGETPTSGDGVGSGGSSAGETGNGVGGNGDGSGESAGGGADGAGASDASGDGAGDNGVGSKGADDVSGVGTSSVDDDGADGGKANSDDKAAGDGEAEGVSSSSSAVDASASDSAASSDRVAASKASAASVEAGNARVAVSQTVSSKPSSGKTYRRGESIEYSVTISNAGDAMLYSIRVSDLITGTTGAPKMAVGDGYDVKGNVAVIAMLTPGNSVQIPVVYTVQAADIGAKIVNTVIVRAADPSGKVVEASSTSDAVSVTALKAPTAPPPPPSLPALLDPVDDELALPAEFEDVPVTELTSERKTSQPKAAEDDADETAGSAGLLSPLGMVGIGVVVVIALAAVLLYARRKRDEDVDA